jgi:hypothetical protein
MLINDHLVIKLKRYFFRDYLLNSESLSSSPTQRSLPFTVFDRFMTVSERFKTICICTRTETDMK